MPWMDRGNGLAFEGEWPPGFLSRLDKLLNQLRATGRNKPERVCDELEKGVRDHFVPKETIWRLSKWCHWSNKEAEAISRDIGNHLFGRYPQPRFLDETNRPTPDKQTAEDRYARWVANVTERTQPPERVTQETRMTDDPLDLLRYFRQAIIYGPHGTGKTRLARQMALTLLSGPVFPEQDENIEERKEQPSAEQNADDGEQELAALRAKERFDLVVFHPSYEYEQFRRDRARDCRRKRVLPSQSRSISSPVPLC